MIEVTSPNQYHLYGYGISVSYYPDGFGPIIEPGGPLHVIYQDAFRSESFRAADTRTVPVEDLGTIVSVTIARTVDTGYTTFSLLIPNVDLPEGQNSVYIQTEGITTVHRLFVGLIGHPQSETYSVATLTGSAAVGPLPL